MTSRMKTACQQEYKQVDVNVPPNGTSSYLPTYTGVDDCFCICSTFGSYKPCWIFQTGGSYQKLP